MFNKTTTNTTPASPVQHLSRSMGERVADGLDDASNELEQGIRPLLNRVTGQLSAGADRAAEAVRSGSQQLRDVAHESGQQTVNYVRSEPAKSMVVAFAAGAALMALLGMFAQRRR